MNKLILFLGAAFLCMGVSAQEPRWSVSILPGYQFNTESYRYGEDCYWKYEGETKTSFVGSVDVGLKLTEKFALHFGYIVDDGKYSERYYSDYYVSRWYPYDAPIDIWEIGPEWRVRLSERAHFYAQINVGRTVASGKATYRTTCGNLREDLVRENAWTFGAAAGFRYFFLPYAGIAGQVSYHRIRGWEAPDLWDARLGVTFRF